MHNFKKIILHTLLLIIFTVLLLISYTLPYFHGESYYYQDYKVRKSLSGTLDTLIIGSSHALRSVKPTVLNENLKVNSYNLSSPLMSMYGRYVLLKKEIERNQIKTVYFEISYNALTLDKKTLGFEGDIYELGRFDNIIERVNFFKNAFSYDEYKKVLSDIVLRSGNSLLRHDKIVQYETYGYLPLQSNNLQLSLEKKKEIKDTMNLDATIKDESLKYFEKIVDMCKENKIKFVLIVTPISENAIIKYKNYDEIFSQYKELADKYDCEYYDFNLDKKRNELYSEETSFYDFTHMSETGAETFSNRLTEILSNAKQGKNTDYEFYESYSEIKKHILNNN